MKNKDNGNHKRSKAANIVLTIFIVIVLLVIFCFMFLFYCLFRGRSYIEFERQVANKNCVWEAKEIDCTLYSNGTTFYEDIKEKYNIESASESDIFGVMKWNEKDILVMFSFCSMGGQSDLSEVYYNTENGYFQRYSDMTVGCDYDINFLKNKFSLKINNEYVEMKDNELAEYLKENDISQITFTKNKKDNNDIFEGTVNEETFDSTYERYEKAFGVNVLSAKYDKKKKQIEIVVRNNKNYDIEVTSLSIGLIGKSSNELVSNWKYEDVLPSIDRSCVEYYYDEIIEACSEIKIVISDIDDEGIIDVMGEVNYYEYADEIYQNPAIPIFNNFVFEAEREYIRKINSD